MKKVYGLAMSLLAVVFVIGCDRSGTTAGNEMLVSGISTRLGVGQDSISAANDTGAVVRDTVDPYRPWTVGLKLHGSDSAKIDSVTVRWGDGSDMEGFNRHSRFLRHQWAIKDTGRRKIELFAWSSGSLVRQDSQFMHVTTHAMALHLCSSYFTTAWNIDSVLSLPITTMDERPLQQVHLHANAVGSDSSFDTIVPANGLSWLNIGLKFPPSGTSDSLVKWSIRLDLLATSGDSTTDKFVLTLMQHLPVLDSVVGMPELALRGDTLRVQAFATASKGISRYEWTINSKVIFLSGDRLVLPMTDTGWICANVKVYDSVGNPSLARDFSQFVRSGAAPVPVAVSSVTAVSGQSIVVPMDASVDSGKTVSWSWNVADRIYQNGVLESVVLSGATQSTSLALTLHAPGLHRLARKATNSRGDTTWDTVAIVVSKMAPGLSELKVQGAAASGAWVGQYLWKGAYSVQPAALDSQDAALPVTIWADTGAGRYDYKVAGNTPLRTFKVGTDTLKLKLVGIYGDSSLVKRSYKVTGLALRDTLVHTGDAVNYVLESDAWNGTAREWNVRAADRKLGLDANGAAVLVPDTVITSGKGIVSFPMALKDTGAHLLAVTVKDAFGASLQGRLSVNVWRRGLRIDSVLASSSKVRMIDGAHYKLGTLLPVTLAVTDSESVVANSSADSACWSENVASISCGRSVVLPTVLTGIHSLALQAFGKPWGGVGSSTYKYVVDSAPIALSGEYVCVKNDSACDVPLSALRGRDPQGYLLTADVSDSNVSTTDMVGGGVGTVTRIQDAKGGNVKLHIHWNFFAWKWTWSGTWWVNPVWQLTNAGIQYKVVSPYGLESSPSTLKITFR
jgi:hypothetical protein